jgi:hypothetical protein
MGDPTISLGVTLAVETENAVRLVGYSLNMLNNSISGPVEGSRPVRSERSAGVERVQAAGAPVGRTASGSVPGVRITMTDGSKLRADQMSADRAVR